MKKLTFILVLLLTVSIVGVNGQQKKYYVDNKKAIKMFEEGYEHYNWNRYEAALERFQSALKVAPKFADCYYAMADIYRERKDYEAQYGVLTKGIAIDSTYYPMAYYSAGVALCNMGDAIESLKFFDLYKRFANPKRMRKDTDKWIEHAKFIKYMYDNPVPYNPRKVGKNLDSEFDVYWPSLTLDGKEIVMTILKPFDMSMFKTYPDMPRTPQYFQEDFCMAQKDDFGEWGVLQDVPDINTNRANEGAQALSPDGMWMFLTICGRQDSKGSCDIYFSRRTKTGWTAPRNIGEPVNTASWESQPCLSADGQTLYFVSGRGGGKGGHDIWKAKIESFKSDGMPVFGKVENLGPNVNSPKDEASPFIHADNKTLYFSSDGWEGLGGMDIFVSRRENEDAEWGTPVNMGYPINSKDDEDGLILNAEGTLGYFAKKDEMPTGNLKQVLYCFDIPVQHRPQPIVYVSGKVYDKETNVPLEAMLELLDYQGNKITLSSSKPSDGTFLLNLPSGHQYALIVTRDDYLYRSETIVIDEPVNESKSVVMDLPLVPIKSGAVITLKNVFFETNSTELKEESAVELMKLVQLMNQNPNVDIEIGGHTDNVGTAEYNAKLSMARAKSTMNFLVEKGINPKRMTAQGYGAKKPIGDNNTEEGRALNRRIEVKIVE